MYHYHIIALAMLNRQAQDYLIALTGRGGGATVDFVQVKNLTQNASLTLNGTDVLHLMGVVGINRVIAQSNSDLRIYPNPMYEQSFIEFEAAFSGITTIEIFEITGKLIAQTQNTLHCGKHTFAVSGLSSGIYTLNIKSAASKDDASEASAGCTGSLTANKGINMMEQPEHPIQPG
jgi:hypothetical protein